MGTSSLRWGVVAVAVAVVVAAAWMGSARHVSGLAVPAVGGAGPPTRVVATVPSPGGVPVADVAFGGDAVFVTRYDGSLTVLDASTGAQRRSGPVGVDPEELVAAADGTRLVVADAADPEQLLVIDPATFAETARIPVGGTVAALVADASATRVYVATGSDLFAVDPAADPAVVARVPSTATSLVLDRGGTRLFAGRAGGQVDVHDAATLQRTGTLPVADGRSIALSPDGRWLWSASFSGDTVSATNAADGSPGPVWPVGDRPAGVAMSPDGSALVLPVLGTDRVAVLDAATGAPMASLDAGPAPRHVVIGPTGRAAVTGPDPERVTLLAT